MSTFNFLNSLINPPTAPVVEAVVSPQEAPAPAEAVTVDETNILKGSARGGIPHSLYVTYTHPSLPEPLYLIAHAVLNGEYSVEDNSFGYSYGSENGTHNDVDDLVEDLAWSNVTLPQISDNMDLFKMAPEQVAHVTKFVAHYITTMPQEAIEQIVDMEKVTNLLKPDNSY